MKVFKYSARLFKFNCIVTPDYENKWKNRGCLLYAASFVVVSLLEGWSSYLFFVKSLSVSKEDAFCAIYQLAVVFGPLTTFFIAQLMRRGVAENFADYQNFYDQNREMDRMGVMQNAEKRGRKIVIIFSVGFACTAFTIDVTTGFGSLFYHLYRDGSRINYSEVHIPYRYVLPWDQNTFYGWLLETIFSFAMPTIFFVSSSGYATLLAATCEYQIAFCKIVRDHIKTIDDYVCSGTYRMADLMLMFHKTISFHIAAKELFIKSGDIYAVFVAPELTHFMFFSTFIAFHYDHGVRNVVLYRSEFIKYELGTLKLSEVTWKKILDFFFLKKFLIVAYIFMAIRHLNLHFALMTMAIVYGIAILYLYCYYGQKVADSYTEIADHLYESDWMNLPIGLQRMYVLMIAHAQKELHFRGAGMVELKRETFLRIVRTIVGYVLMFKTMAEQSA